MGFDIAAAILSAIFFAIFGGYGFSAAQKLRNETNSFTNGTHIMWVVIIVANLVYFHWWTFYVFGGGWFAGFLLGKIMPKRK